MSDFDETEDELTDDDLPLVPDEDGDLPEEPAEKDIPDGFHSIDEEPEM